MEEITRTIICPPRDQLTVGKLRTMSEAKDGETILVIRNGFTRFEQVRYFEEEHWHEEFIGWIPMPVYKP